MTFRHYAIIKEKCPGGCQGQLLVAATEDQKTYYVACDVCDAEWSTPEEALGTAPATRDRFSFSRFIEADELKEHEWYKWVLNKGSSAWN
jgi:hypothetical protein